MLSRVEGRPGESRALTGARGDGFLAYTHWVYTNELDMSLVTDPEAKEGRTSYLSCGKVWILANYMQDQELCNQAINHIITKLAERPAQRIAVASL